MSKRAMIAVMAMASTCAIQIEAAAQEPEARNIAFIVKDAIVQGYPRDAYEEYAERMTELEALETPPFGATPLQERLWRIARDRASNSEYHDTVLSECVSAESLVGDWRWQRHGGAKAHPPKAEHLSPEYQLAWEYYFFAPKARGWAPLYERSVRRAVASYRDPALLPALYELVELTCSAGLLDDFGSTRQSVKNSLQYTMEVIGSYESEEGLIAMLECAGIILHEQEKPKYDELANDPSSLSSIRWDVVKYTKGVVSAWDRGRLTTDLKPEWADLLAQCDTSRLSEGAKRVYDNIK